MVRCSSRRWLMLLASQTLVFFGFFSFLLHRHATLEQELDALKRSSPANHPQQHRRNDECNDDDSDKNADGTTTPTLSVLPANETRRILLVHVGKTGGETLKHILRIGCRVRSNPVQQDECWRKFVQQYASPTTTTTTTSTMTTQATTLPPEPLLSQLVTGYFHYRRITPPTALNQSTHLLFSIRHPLSRIQSWFRYITPLNCIRPKQSNATTTATTTQQQSALDWSDEQERLRQARKRRRRRQQDADGIPLTCRVRQAFANKTSPEAQFFGCFPTLEALAQTLPYLLATHPNRRDSQTTTTTAAASKPPSEACVAALKEILLSNSRHMWGPSELLLGHFVRNYHYYAQRTIAVRKDVSLLAVRTESMWDDLQGLEDFLHRPPGSLAAAATSASSENAFGRVHGLQVTHYQHNPNAALVDQALLSQDASRFLCCALQHELQIYRTLVERAQNLNLTEKEQSLAHSTEYCHYGSWKELLKTCQPYRRLTQQRGLAI